MEQVEDDPIRMLVGLITTTATTNQVQARDELLRALVTLLCSNNNKGMNLWHAFRGNGGVRLLISLLPGVGLPPGPLQEYALSLLRLLSYENDGSMWFVTTALVDQLLPEPIPHPPPPAAAPSLALRLLTRLANDCLHNQIVMVKAGALEALTTYLSLCPPGGKEAATDLLGLLFSSRQIRRHRNYEPALGATSQLIAVLKEGGRGARCSAAKALNHLFLEYRIRNDEITTPAVPPLAEILNTASEEEGEEQQHTAIATLVRLLADFPIFAHGDAEVERISLEVLGRILSSSNCSMEMKRCAAELCYLILRKYEILSTTAAACCVEPLVSLVVTELGPCHLPAVKALYLLVEVNGELAKVVVALGAVVPLVHLLKTKEEEEEEEEEEEDEDDDDERLQVVVCRLLKKLGEEMPACKEEMLNAGAIKIIDDIHHQGRPLGVLGFELPELLRMLTNNKRRCRKRSIRRRIPFWESGLSDEDGEFCYATFRGKRRKMAAD